MSFTTPDTIPRLLAWNCAQRADAIAIRFYRDGRWQSWTWAELADLAARAAVGLIRRGVQPGDRVVLLAENRGEWLLADLAIQFAQAIHVPVHATLSAAQVGYQLRHSSARIAIVSGDEQARKVATERDATTWTGTCLAFDWASLTTTPETFSPFDGLLDGVDDQSATAVWQAALRDVQPDSVATILYTSGTTGEPKGVQLSHRNLVTNAQGANLALGGAADALRLNFLPLSHIFARTCDFYTTLASGSELALAQSRETVISDCGVIQPTFLNGVPYFFDRLRRGLVEAEVADTAAALRALLGGRIEMCCSGGAALPDHVFDFYVANGIPLLQGYGLTESSPVITVSSPQHPRRGSVGRPIDGVQVRIADDGEVLTRGPHVMLGYYMQPAETARAICDGWLYTGDLGRLDEDGYLYITGRKKELIVTSGGKNVAPVQLETLLTSDPLILQAMVIGDNRSFLTALIVPNADVLAAQAAARGIDYSPADPNASDEIRGLFSGVIAARLADLSHYEQVRQFALLPRPFSLEHGELTPKLSMRRAVIADHWQHLIDSMYKR